MSCLNRAKPVLGLVFVVCLAASPATTAAGDDPKKVESSLTFIAHTETIYVNIDNESLAAWVNPIFEVVDTRFLSETKPRTIVVEVTLHPDRPAEIVVAARPRSPTPRPSWCSTRLTRRGRRARGWSTALFGLLPRLTAALPTTPGRSSRRSCH